jgi:hypothetical protein
MIVSMADVKEAERIAKAQCIAAGMWLRVDESKIGSPKDMMLIHRVRSALIIVWRAAFEDGGESEIDAVRRGHGRCFRMRQQPGHNLIRIIRAR